MAREAAGPAVREDGAAPVMLVDVPEDEAAIFSKWSIAPLRLHSPT
jgi:hypothetical protein